MCTYFQNLLFALAGRNPLAEDFARLSDEHIALGDDYAKANVTISELDGAIHALECKLSELESVNLNLSSENRRFQKLTEDLRQHLEEKNNEIRNTKEFYEKRSTQMMQKTEELREDLDATLEQLQRVNNDKGKEMMSSSLLRKTNIALNDLLEAMKSGSPEAMKQVAEYIDWNPLMAKVARCHLDFLTKQNELKEFGETRMCPTKAV